MATYQDVDQFLTSYTPALKAELRDDTKEHLLELIDNFEGHGHTQEDLAKTIEERVSPYSLSNASEQIFVEVVTDLAAHTAAAAQATGIGGDQIITELVTALAWDANAEIDGTKDQFFAYVLDQIWTQVRAGVEAELEAADVTWDSVEEARTAAWEPAYWAMMAAVDGLWDAGEAEGGFAALLSRPQS